MINDMRRCVKGTEKQLLQGSRIQTQQDPYRLRLGLRLRLYLNKALAKDVLLAYTVAILYSINPRSATG